MDESGKPSEIMALIDVWKIYKMGEVEVTALKNVNLSIHKGDYTVIMGPSGSGKSTFLQIIGCLDQPSKGKVLIEGIDTSTMTDSNLAGIRNKKIGFVFQSFNLLPKLSALENCALPMIYNGVSSKKRKEKAIQLLEKVGLGDRIKHRPTQLSGGQQQRVAIARALANEPNIILADEPTGNLDSKSSVEILELLKSFNGEGKTIIVVTHDPDMVKEGKTIVWIKDGEIERVQVND